MKIHKVRSPFRSRIGQFEEGEQTLVIGLGLNALKNEKVIRCYLGNNTKCYYEINYTDALVLVDKYKSMWKSPKGIDVAILPLKDFKRVDMVATEPLVKKPEAPPENPQRSLL